MSNARATEGDARPDKGRAIDADLVFLSRWAGPLGLIARAMFAYIFIVDGVGAIADYAGVGDYTRDRAASMREHLPLVILTELGGGLLVLFGLKTRWAALGLFGFCLLTALFFHLGADQTVHFQKNLCMAGGFLMLAIIGHIGP